MPCTPSATAWIAVAALGSGVAAGALLLGNDSSESAQTDSGATIRALNFETPGPAERRVILDLGGLTIAAACNRVGDKRPVDLLSVTATSEFKGASAVSSFLQQDDRGTRPYWFTLRDLDPDYGAYDFLGSPYRVAGDLLYSRPDGGQVSVSYVTDQGRSADGCRFRGTAVYAPT